MMSALALPRQVWRRLDGLAWLAMAGFLAWLVLAGNYWMYLNPRFKPLTLAAAAALAVFGGYAAWRPVSRPSLGRALGYAALCLLAVVSEGGTQFVSDKLDSDPFMVAPPLPAAPTAPVPSRLIAGGREYVPINTGELFDIAAKGHGAAFERPYAVRGFVHRSPELEAKGEFVLYRLAIWCCFADGTAVGFRVRPPAGTPLPEDKAWVVAYGRLTDAPADDRKEYALPGMAFSSVAPAAILEAAQLETAAVAPEDIYMFQWRQEEPYAF